MEAVKAQGYAPGHVSCVFKVVEAEDPCEMHSLGLGFTVDEGVQAVVGRSNQPDHLVSFNGKLIECAPVRDVLNSLLSPERGCATVRLSVHLQSRLPLGSGFGLSGAACLATSFAVNKLLRLNLSRVELGMLSHTAEVCNLTGLGDVCGQFHGGCLIKLEAGKPLVAQRAAILAGQDVYVRVLGPLSTADILSSASARVLIAKAGASALESLRELSKAATVQLSDIAEISFKFARDSGLLERTNVGDLIKQIRARGGHASMIMLGNAVFADIDFPGALRLRLAEDRAL